eukprot:UN22441
MNFMFLLKFNIFFSLSIFFHFFFIFAFDFSILEINGHELFTCFVHIFPSIALSSIMVASGFLCLHSFYVYHRSTCMQNGFSQVRLTSLIV